MILKGDGREDGSREIERAEEEGDGGRGERVADWGAEQEEGKAKGGGGGGEKSGLVRSNQEEVLEGGPRWRGKSGLGVVTGGGGEVEIKGRGESDEGAAAILKESKGGGRRRKQMHGAESLDLTLQLQGEALPLSTRFSAMTRIAVAVPCQAPPHCGCGCAAVRCDHVLARCHSFGEYTDF